MRALATNEDKRDNFRRHYSYGTRGGIHSVLEDPHENDLRISMQNVQHKNVFKPARQNRDNCDG